MRHLRELAVTLNHPLVRINLYQNDEMLVYYVNLVSSW